ncbi:MAG: ECF-type sigma factor [Isosphaeraceae bacterium]
MNPTVDETREARVRALYDELHRVAVLLMRREKPGHTLQPSALVHETLMRLMARGELDERVGQRELLNDAVVAMRGLLIDHHRRRTARKRGGGWQRHPLDAVLDHFETRERLQFIDLHHALDELAALQPRQALVVTFRYFLGMTAPRVGEVLGVHVSTVESDWRLARAWLYDRLGGGSP